MPNCPPQLVQRFAISPPRHVTGSEVWSARAVRVTVPPAIEPLYPLKFVINEWKVASACGIAAPFVAPVCKVAEREWQL